MDNNTLLQQQKAALQAKLELERADLKKTFQEIREAIEPARLLKNAISGALGFSKNKSAQPATHLGMRLPAPIGFLVDVLVRDPKWALGLKLLGPIVLNNLPKFERTKKPLLEENLGQNTEKPTKLIPYSRIRQGIASLRNKLHRTPKPITDHLEN